VKNGRTTTNSAAFPDLHKGKPSRIEDREQGAGQDCRAARSSARRRSARGTAEQGSLGSLPKGAVLVGANVLLREGLSRILAAAGYRIVASALCADAQLLSTLQRERSILFIIDLSDDFDAGLTQIALFRERCPAGRVVVLGDQAQLSGMVSAFRAGANAYLVKVTTCETFVKSLELVMLGVTLLPPEILNFISDRQRGGHNDGDHAPGVADDGHAGDAENLGRHEIVEADVEGNERPAGADRGQTPRLSTRERAILRCLTEGDSNKIVAGKMAMTEATVKVHIKTILRKIRVRNRTQAAIWAMSNDPLRPAKEEAPLASDELRVEPTADLNIARVLSGGYRNGSKSLAAIKVKEPNHTTMRGEVRLLRKRS
jgi:two-component system nitrate/nitrite response regulator NarL